MQIQAACTHILETMALWMLSSKSGQLLPPKSVVSRLGSPGSVLLKGDMFLHSSEVSMGSELQLVLSTKPLLSHTPQHRELREPHWGYQEY